MTNLATEAMNDLKKLVKEYQEVIAQKDALIEDQRKRIERLFDLLDRYHDLASKVLGR